MQQSSRCGEARHASRRKKNHGQGTCYLINQCYLINDRRLGFTTSTHCLFVSLIMHSKIPLSITVVESLVSPSETPSKTS